MINRVTLVGNLGQDPELKTTPSGQSVCQLRLATTEVYKDREGQKQEATEWHTVVVWGNQAEACGRHLAKGRQVYVEGKIKTRKWTDKDGKERFTTEVVAADVRFLGSAPKDKPAPADELGYGWGY
jgi:single-strand DNA-binding protein